MTKASHARAMKVAGTDAKAIRRDLAAFARSSRVFSANSPRLIDKYEDKWVAVYDGKIAAAADSLKKVTAKVEKLGLPLANTMIRRIERKPKTFIL